MENSIERNFVTDPNIYFQFDLPLKIDNIDLFVGRKDTLEQAIRGSLSDSSHMVIFGSRGIGKSSFGWQLFSILEGEKKNVNALQLNDYYIADKYLCSWYTVSGKPKNILEVLKNILISTREKDSVFRLKFKDVFDDALVKKISGTDFSDFNQAVEVFQETVDKIKKYNPDKIPVIFIDEFENIEEKDGVGQLLKIISDVKLVMIGVAETLSEIIKDHTSAERKLLNSKILIGGLKESDIDKLYDRAQNLSKNHIEYTQGFRHLLYNYSEGFPYLIQLVGFKSILHFFSERLPKITFDSQEFHLLFKDVVKYDTNIARFDLIVSSIGTQATRQQILFVIALANGWIAKKEILEKLDDQTAFNIHITAMVNRELLVNDGKNNIKFKDPITKAIVRYYADTGNSFL